MKNPPHNVAASVRQRLLNLSKASGVDYNQLLIRYAIERLLYRLSRSRHRQNFVLKGAMLFVIWEGSPHRPTQDVDLLGFGDRSPDRIAGVFRELCEASVEDDGITFAANTVQAEEKPRGLWQFVTNRQAETFWWRIARSSACSSTPSRGSVGSSSARIPSI